RGLAAHAFLRDTTDGSSCGSNCPARMESRRGRGLEIWWRGRPLCPAYSDSATAARKGEFQDCGVRRTSGQPRARRKSGEIHYFPGTTADAADTALERAGPLRRACI